MERSSSLFVQFTIQVTRKMRYLLKVARLPGFELRLHHLLVELPGASHLSSLWLSCLICTKGMIYLPTGLWQQVEHSSWEQTTIQFM